VAERSAAPRPVGCMGYIDNSKKCQYAAFRFSLGTTPTLSQLELNESVTALQGASRLA